MIPRTAQDVLLDLAQSYPILVITGPRQSGKTTLVRNLFAHKPYVSLEDPDQREFADQDPRGFLGLYPDGAVLDEVQRCPDLFSYLQTRVDADRRTGLFVLTGSQQFGLLSNITQTLSGRAALVQLLTFTLAELNAASLGFYSVEQLLFTGFYPSIHDRKLKPGVWYSNYVQTYLERDVRQMINVQDLNAFQRFLRMCAARTGQLVNLSSLANDCGITHNTAKAWLSVLEASYIVLLLPPHHRNFNKRLIKTPKLYFLDPGLAAWLLGIQGPDQLILHPMRGALFESWVVSELFKAKYNNVSDLNFFFWRDRTGNEVDVLIERGRILLPLEIKAGQTVSRDFTKGIDMWRGFAGGDKGWVVYAGDARQKRWRDIPELAVRILSV